MDPVPPRPVASRRPAPIVNGRWLVILALVLIGAYLFLFPGLSVSPIIVDDSTGLPIAGARASTPRDAATSDATGQVTVWLKPADPLRFDADGYEVGRLQYWPWVPLRVALRPLPASAAASVQQAAAAQVALPASTRELQGSMLFVLSAVSGNQPTQLPLAAADAVRIRVVPRLRGVVTDARSGRPIPRATVSVAGQVVESATDGTFEVWRRPVSGRLWAISPGYLRAETPLSEEGGMDIALEPFEVRALYLTFFAIGNDDLRERALRLIDESSLNAVVIDIKGDRGFIAYPTAVELAEKVGANAAHTIADPRALIARLKARGIYTIARIVVFKDDRLGRYGALHGVDVAIRNAATGQPWIDGEGLAWVDPFQERAWEYNIALAKEAAAQGFDEVQFDYIRFPTDPAAGSSVEHATYSQPFTEERRLAAMATFLERARRAVNSEGAYLSVDTFGYTAWSDDDLGIGQNLSRFGEHVDFICPMVYPSTFSAGLPRSLNYPEVVRQPYKVIFESMIRASQRVNGRRALLRPWLQYFDDYPWATNEPYGLDRIEAQVRATQDSRSFGYQLWDPTNQYVHGVPAERP